MMDRDDETRLLPRDFVSLNGVLRVCRMETVLLNASDPHATIDNLTQGDALFCSAETSFPFRGRFVLPTSWCLLGYIHLAQEGSWCHGIPFSTDTAFTVLPEGSCEFVFNAGTRITFVLLPLEKLEKRHAELAPLRAGSSTRLRSLVRLSDTPVAQRLHWLYQKVRQRLIRIPSADEAAADPIDIETLLDAHLGTILAATEDDLPNWSRGRRKHYLILQRTEQFMRDNLRNDIYVTELCNAAGVSERALRYAFEDLLGISPNRYLSMLRLCTACRSLTLSDISRSSVKSVALSCGLWDLSRFADSYRRVFGELPHDTLMRSPPGDALSGP
jgi:AraC family ethanolamine operon transcriptional activator